ncbi:hprA, partial [Symbiodinium microadriaticum]
YVELVTEDPLSQRPKWFVSHAWSEPVASFAQCLEQHSRLRDLEDKGRHEIMSGMNTVNQSTFEQSDVAMHEGGGVTADSGEPVRLLYTNLQDPSGLADLLLDERVDIRLVRGTCLKALDRKKPTFIRRQELENNPSYPDAFVTREELQKWKQDRKYRDKVRIIGVSHVWETREHPDPRGHQLALIAGAQRWHDRYSWYFLDYMSVYQFYRTSIHQNRSFQYTMMHMHFFYTHEYTWTYRIEDLTPFRGGGDREAADVRLALREFPILAGALPLYKKLKVLRISNSQVDCQGAEALSIVLTMSELHFNKIRITADAVCKLALGLKGNSGVLKVALTECLVDEEGAAGLAEALACKDTSLTSLDLSRNVVGCTGAKHLSDALIRNERLRILDLSSSSIADEGAARFASLFESTVLQWLSLNHNCFGSKAMAILQTGRNKSLRRHGEVKLRVQCEGGPSLRILEEYDGCALIARALEACRTRPIAIPCPAIEKALGPASVIEVVQSGRPYAEEANNQHELGTDLTHDPLHSSFFRAMCLCEGVLLVLDQDATPFRRIWCCFEQSVAITATRENRLLLDISHCPESAAQAEVITDGVTVTDLREKKRTIYRNIDGYEDSVKAHREVRILNTICKKTSLDSDPPDSSPHYDEVDSGQELSQVCCNLRSFGYNGLFYSLKIPHAKGIEADARRGPDSDAVEGYDDDGDDADKGNSNGNGDDDDHHKKFDDEACPSTAMTTITSLIKTLSECRQVTDAGVQHLASRLPKKLLELNLNFEGFEHLAMGLMYRLPTTLHALVLNFMGCHHVSDHGVATLAEADGKTVADDIAELCAGLAENVTDVGISTLAASESAPAPSPTLAGPPARALRSKAKVPSIVTEGLRSWGQLKSSTLPMDPMLFFSLTAPFLRPPGGEVHAASASGKTCLETCLNYGLTCLDQDLLFINHCAALATIFKCRACEPGLDNAGVDQSGVCLFKVSASDLPLDVRFALTAMLSSNKYSVLKRFEQIKKTSQRPWILCAEAQQLRVPSLGDVFLSAAALSQTFVLVFVQARAPMLRQLPWALGWLAASEAAAAVPPTAVVDPSIVSSLALRLPASEWRLIPLDTATEEELESAEVLCPPFSLARNTSAFSSLLQKVSSGKLLQWMAAGTDLINMSAVPSHFAICDVHQGGVAIPEYVLAGILQWNVRMMDMDSAFRRCTWRSDLHNNCTRPKPHKEVYNQTVGIVGFGTIGRGVGQRAAAFGMRVIAVDEYIPSPVPSYVSWIGHDDQLPKLMAEADFVVVAVPLVPATRGLIGPKELSYMKQDGVLINVARGPIVDENALWQTLQGEQIGGAILDVWWHDFSWYQNGSWPSTYNFSSLPNVWMTPHVSVHTLQAQNATYDQAAANFMALAAGRPLKNVVRNASVQVNAPAAAVLIS